MRWKRLKKAKIRLDIASYKLYYVYLEIACHPRTEPPYPRHRLRLTSLLTLAAWGLCFFAREFVADVLFDKLLIGADHPAPVDEQRGRARDFNELAIGYAVVHGFGCFRARHARLEGVGVQPDLLSVVHHLIPDVFRGNDRLVVINLVIQGPEGVGLLVVGASPCQRGSARPGVDVREGKI